MVEFTPSSPGSRRRSQRVPMPVSICISGAGSLGENFEENTETLSINIYGALISLEARLISGSNVRLRHNLTQKEQECRVVFLGPTRGTKKEIGLEFTAPRSDFWGVTFPADAWTSKDTEVRG